MYIHLGAPLSQVRMRAFKDTVVADRPVQREVIIYTHDRAEMVVSAAAAAHHHDPDVYVPPEGASMLVYMCARVRVNTEERFRIRL